MGFLYMFPSTWNHFVSPNKLRCPSLHAERDEGISGDSKRPGISQEDGGGKTHQKAAGDPVKCPTLCGANRFSMLMDFQGEFKEVQTLLKKETMALEQAWVCREKEQAELNKVDCSKNVLYLQKTVTFSTVGGA